MKKLKKLNLCFSIHFSFLCLMFLGVLVGAGRILILYFTCLIFHEIIHAVVARKRGYKIGKIKLLATGVVLEAESDEFSFMDEIAIAISGPLFNLIFSLFLMALWWIIPESFNFTQDLFVVNLAIFAFNMLPIFPLDGGRVFLAFLSMKISRKKAVYVVKMVAICLAIAIFCLFVFSLFSNPNFGIGITATTLFIGGIAEDKSAIYKRTFFYERKKQRITKGGLEVKYICVSSKIEDSKLLSLLSARFYTIFVRVGENLERIEEITEEQLLQRLAKP